MPLHSGRIVVVIRRELAKDLARIVGAGGPDVTNIAEAAAAVPALLPLRNAIALLPVVSANVATRGSSTREQVKLEIEFHGAQFDVRGLVGFFALTLKDAQASEGDVEPILETLEQTPGVQRVYLERMSESAKIGKSKPPAADEDDAGSLRFLDPTPWGIGARAKSRWRGTGTGVGFADVEADGVGWNLSHQAFSKMQWQGAVIPANAFDPKVAGLEPHGTMSLGVIFSDRTGDDAKGVAPRAQVRGLFSTETLGVDGAIQAAAHVLSPGDVMLLAMQSSGLPLELAPLAFGAIRNATSKGIIVVEAAGNGQCDLDGIARSTRIAPAWVDEVPGIPMSGAIMVGACRNVMVRDSKRHRLMDLSNFGSRVDCYAWGEGVPSVGDVDGAATVGLAAFNRWVSDRFNGTSAASAIIAGFVLLVQQRYKARKKGSVLTADELRPVLQKAAVGTPIDVNPPRFMPDLAETFTLLGIN